jgi:hypothetical protein
MMKTPEDFEVIDHGVDHEQYFPGCGVALTEFTDCATGTGESAHDALEDALESLAQGDWNTSKINVQLSKKEDVTHEDHHHYVTVRVK